MILGILLFIAAAADLDLQSASKAEITELGNCLPSSSATLAEEERVRGLARSAQLLDSELLARLVFSEALATGFWRDRCAAKTENEIIESITWGVLNRVKREKKKKDAIARVIFAPQQFRTSFSAKKQNPFAAAFLCPRSAQTYLDATPSRPRAIDLFHNVRRVTVKLLENYHDDGIPAKFSGITHFFYPRSEFFGEIRPSWAPHSNPSENKGYVPLLNSPNPCVEFYRL